jgi:hypothetical protein
VEKGVTLHEAEEGYGPKHDRRAWDMDEEGPLFVVEITEAERMAASKFPNANADMDSANNTSVV